MADAVNAYACISIARREPCPRLNANATTATYLLVDAGEEAARHVARVGADRLLFGLDVLLEAQRVDGDFVVEPAAHNEQLISATLLTNERAQHVPACNHVA